MGKVFQIIWPWISSAIWWVADRIWGDRVFESVKPMIPEEILNIPTRELITWVPTIVLVSIGILIAIKKTKTPEISKIQNSALPPTSASIARRDIKMRDALMFIETGKWPDGHTYSLMAAHKTGGELPSNRMREATKYGEVKVWGKPSHNAQYDLIPADYWKIWKIDWHSNPDGECQTERVESHSDGFKYYDLMVNKAEIENRWPPKTHPRPDYAKWDKLSDFRLDHAACLWIDREPSQHLDDDETAVFRKLEGHVSNRTLEVKRDDLREVISDAFRKADGHVVKANPEWRVERSSLLSLAVTLGEKPPFLYKKERIK